MRTYAARHAHPAPPPAYRVGWGHRLALFVIVVSALAALTPPA